MLVSYAKLLARAVVNLQIAQALPRHSHPKFTVRTYTNLVISDGGKVVSLLPTATRRKNQPVSREREAVRFPALAALLVAQKFGGGWQLRAFCGTNGNSHRKIKLGDK